MGKEKPKQQLRTESKICGSCGAHALTDDAKNESEYTSATPAKEHPVKRLLREHFLSIGESVNKVYVPAMARLEYINETEDSSDWESYDRTSCRRRHEAAAHVSLRHDDKEKRSRCLIDFMLKLAPTAQDKLRLLHECVKSFKKGDCTVYLRSDGKAFTIVTDISKFSTLYDSETRNTSSR